MKPQKSRPNERCYFCRVGKLEERQVTLTVQKAGRLMVLEDVPAEVCDSCGEQYFSPEVSRKIEMKVSEILETGKADREMTVPVASVSS